MNKRPSDIYLPDGASSSAKKRFDAKAEEAQMAVAWDTMVKDLEEGQQARKALPAIEAKLDRLESKTPVLRATLSQPRAKPKATVKVPRSTDIAFARATAHFTKKTVAKVAAELFPGDAGKLQRKAATAPAATVSAGGGAELARFDVGPWVEEIRDVSVFGEMAARGVPLPMSDLASITMPQNPGTGDISGSFVGEKGTIPVKSGVVGAVSFFRYKAAVLSVFTNELRDTSTPNIEAVIRRNVVTDTANMLDGYILNPANAATAGIRPASPWNGASNQASSGNTFDDIIQDLAFLLNLLTAKRARNPVIIMDNARAQRLRLTISAGVFPFRDEVENGFLMGIPLIVSNNVPTDHVFCIDLDDFAFWLPTPEVDTSGSAVVAMADDNPASDPHMDDQNAVNDSGGSIHINDALNTFDPNKTSEVISSFQMNATILRHVQMISFGLLRRDTAGYLTAVSW